MQADGTSDQENDEWNIKLTNTTVWVLNNVFANASQGAPLAGRGCPVGTQLV